jgi:hypothetical protein
MTGNIRTAVLGMLAGAAASAPLALSLGHPRSSVALGMAIDIAYAVVTRGTPQGNRLPGFIFKELARNTRHSPRNE